MRQRYNQVDFIDVIKKVRLSIYTYCYHAYKNARSLTWFGKFNIFTAFILAFIWSVKNNPLWWLHLYFPDIVSKPFVRDMGRLPWVNHFIFWGALVIVGTICILAHGNVTRMKKVTKALKRAGLKNALGITPRAIDITTLTLFRHKVVIDTEGVPAEEFEKKKNTIRACVNSQVEAIIEQSQPKFIDLFLTQHLLPKKVPYAKVCGMALKSGEFVVGQTHGRIVTQNLFELPHLLVAGTTGMGKSFFLRQMLLNLLENTPHLQVYALDFKEGISMKPFRGYPRVKVVKDVFEAVEVLETVKCEMEERLKLLEASDDDVIDTEKHKKDPILVIIDECSMLYSLSGKTDIEKSAADRATQITDQIAKLSRAAHIHLVLGTQKITKETISTHIQENIEGRICFKMLSVQGSALVIGTKMARDLPKIAGRAISRVGADIDEVQTPFISVEDIRERVEKLKSKLDELKSHQELVSNSEYTGSISTSVRREDGS